MSRNHFRRFRYDVVLGLLLPLIITSCSGGDPTDARGVSMGGISAILATTSAPWAVTMDRRGNLYVSDSQKGHVEMMMPDGMKTVLAEGLSSPTGIAVSSGGRVYVCEALAGRVRCIHPDGTLTLVAEGLKNPTGITLDRDGGLFVACRGDGAIVKIQPGF